MKTNMRLDKYLADMGVGTRSEVKERIRKGRVLVNGKVVRAAETKVDTENDEICCDGEAVGYTHYEYYMLNKPAGVISATDDKKSETVIDLIASKRRKDLFPVGRLDKDTEGLLLITNDGALAHQLLSPKKHVPKVYYARVDGCVTKEDVEAFAGGLKVDEELTAMPAKMTVLSMLPAGSEITLEIHEGKFHQVKRMFEAVDKTVVYLKRLSMGPLTLDETLAPGAYRELTQAELAALKNLSDTRELAALKNLSDTNLQNVPAVRPLPASPRRRNLRCAVSGILTPSYSIWTARSSIPCGCGRISTGSIWAASASICQKGSRMPSPA